MDLAMFLGALTIVGLVVGCVWLLAEFNRRG